MLEWYILCIFIVHNRINMKKRKVNKTSKQKTPAKKKHNHLEYSRIQPYLYIGTSICCQYHFEQLIKKGIKADVDLQEEKQDKPSGVASFLWLPTTDFTPPSQIQLTIGAHFIEDLVTHKMRCYVHCNAGRGRAPTLVAAYYILHYQLTPREAIRKIRKKRSKVNPNKYQILALEKFYKKLYGRSSKHT